MKDKIIKILESYIVDNLGETCPRISIDSIESIAGEILSLQLLQLDVMRSAFDAGRERIKHPDWDFLYDDFDEWIGKKHFA